jgi:hypothetical protein
MNKLPFAKLAGGVGIWLIGVNQIHIKLFAGFQRYNRIYFVMVAIRYKPQCLSNKLEEITGSMSLMNSLTWEDNFL